MKKIICLLFICAWFPTSQAADFVPKPGQHYRILESVPSALAGKDVVEFFWYGCPSCREFSFASEAVRKSHPERDWHYQPAVFRPDWRRHAKLFYLIRNEAQFELLHSELFRVLGESAVAFDDPGDLARWLQQYGVKAEDIEGSLSAFSLNQQLKQDQQILEQLSLRGVPAMLVGGRYLLDATMVADLGDYLTTLNHLLRLSAPERAASLDSLILDANALERDINKMSRQLR